MRLSTALTVNMPMLAENLRKIEALVAQGRAGGRVADATKTLVLPMVKGNAYGCGIVPISRFLSQRLGYKTLGVATLHEAVHTLSRLPELAADATQNFVVFSDTELQHPEWQRYYSQHPSPPPVAQQGVPFVGSGLRAGKDGARLAARIIPVLGTKADVSYYLDSLEGEGQRSPFFHTPLFVKVNTGMNRMGLLPEELVALSPRIRRLRAPNANASASSGSAPPIHIQKGGVDLLLQHFSSSWYPVGSSRRDQEFLEWTRGARNPANQPAAQRRGCAVEPLSGEQLSSLLPPAPLNTTLQQYHTCKTLELYLRHCCCLPVHDVSVSNSGAIEQGVGTCESVVRPGLMMYGPPSTTTPNRIWDGNTVGRLETRILKIFAIGDGGAQTEEAQTDQRGDLNSRNRMEEVTISNKESKIIPPFPSYPRSQCVGYGFNATRGPAVVALLALGYADGFLRYNTGLPVTINGLKGEVHGFVNMDLTQVVFYPHELGTSVEAVLAKLHEIVANTPAGSPNVTIWSHDNADIDGKATFLKTNAYQLLTALSVRVPRVYECGDYPSDDTQE